MGLRPGIPSISATRSACVRPNGCAILSGLRLARALSSTTRRLPLIPPAQGSRNSAPPLVVYSLRFGRLIRIFRQLRRSPALPALLALSLVELGVRLKQQRVAGVTLVSCGTMQAGAQERLGGPYEVWRVAPRNTSIRLRIQRDTLRTGPTCRLVNRRDCCENGNRMPLG